MATFASDRQIPPAPPDDAYSAMVKIPLLLSASCMIIPNDFDLTIQCRPISHASPLISPTPVGVCCGLGIHQHRLIPGFFSNATRQSLLLVNLQRPW